MEQVKLNGTAFPTEVDLDEDAVFNENHNLLEILLIDHSTKQNILWMTDNYELNGDGYGYRDQITIPLITDTHRGIIKPRVKKSAEEQLKRSRDKAEVFTPSWICNRQNNLVDNEWLKKENLFNTEEGTSWKATTRKIPFSYSKKSWQDYVLANRLEISCGEAPYLVSRYDTTSGQFIDVNDRIGMLDRKLRVVNENTETKEEWLEWTRKAFQSTYGFEWQGDNLLLARENFLLTYIDYYKARFDGEWPSNTLLEEIAEIISWNLWQMDGIKFVVPESCHDEIIEDTDLFGGTTITVNCCMGCKNGDIHKHNGIQCLIMDWKEGKTTNVLSLLGEGK